MSESKGKMAHRHKMEMRVSRAWLGPSLSRTDDATQALEKQLTTLGKQHKAWSKDQVQAEAVRLREELEARHKAEMGVFDEPASAAGEDEAPSSSEAASKAEVEGGEEDETSASKKRGKAARRRDKRAAEAAAREEEIERYHEELAAAGGSKRDRELAVLGEALAAKGLGVFPVPADGNCLFAAVNDQLRRAKREAPGGTLRDVAARYIREHADEFGPFLPFMDSDGDFAIDPEGTVDRYCARLASTREWGGMPEAKALAMALSTPIVVHRAQGGDVSLGSDDADGALHITFHEHFVSTGAHYNSTYRLDE
jgi:OTU domain-containing protein 6